MGFRLSVQALLPIGGRSLVYGSDDGGKSYKTCKEPEKIMKYIGKQLYLKPHICVDKFSRKHILIGPADIEIHCTKSGSHFYIVGKKNLENMVA